MLKAIRRALAGAQEHHSSPRHELHLAVAVLLHEARRADYAEHGKEAATAQAGLADLFVLEPAECTALLEEGRLKAEQLTSFYAPVSIVKREFSMDDRIRLVEHLWRVSFAEGGLHWYEDHYVRKIAHLLHVPNTQAMLARNRARPTEGQ
jgi:uncharacterized tellurite resistance protein B-like protein